MIQFNVQIRNLFGNQNLTNRAAGTMGDFVHGLQGVLWAISSMDTTEGGERVGPLELWAISSTDSTGTTGDFVHGHHRGSRSNKVHYRRECDGKNVCHESSTGSKLTLFDAKLPIV